MAMNQDFALMMLFKPLGTLLFLGLWALICWIPWRFLPPGRLRRILFFKLWARDDAWPPGPSLLSRLLRRSRASAGEAAPSPPPSALPPASRR